jgi:hypothetical protein
VTILAGRMTPRAGCLSETGRYVVGRLTLRGLLVLAVAELTILALAGVSIVGSGSLS